VTDVRIVQSTSLSGVTLDWLLTSAGSLDETEELATAVMVALGTDRLAQPDDVMPDPDDDDRRGWWGDLDAAAIWNGWPIGSRLWEMRRDKITGSGADQGSTLVRAETFAREALQPFLDQRICSRIDVLATRADVQQVDLQIVIYRGPKVEIDLRYQMLWSQITGIKGGLA
jgi:phage gp46-like protein